MWTPEQEKAAEKLLARLRAEPLAKEREEFGKMLMRHIDSYTPEERKRYDELKEFMDTDTKEAEKQLNEELKKEIIDILDNVSYWETCPEDYKTRIEAIKQQLHIGVVTLSLREQLIERYSALLTKNYKYQMGDDDFALTTEELRICRPLNIILQDLKN
jgi:hypothetical protein